MRRLLLVALLCLIGATAHAQAPVWQHNGTTSANVLPNSPTNPSYVAPATGAGTTDVNLKQVGGVATAVGAGAVTAGTPRVTLASDDPAVSGITTTNTDLGPPGATACATDTGSCSLNALMQRLAQRLTTINTTLGTPMQATGGTVGIVAGTAIIGKVGIDQTTPGTTNLVAAGQNGTWTVQPGNTPNTSPWLVTSTPSSASGSALTPVSSSALAANTVIKASAGNLSSFTVSADSTLSAAAWWIMIYNATSAPVDGAVTPLKCYAMPAGTTGFSAAFTTPVAFSTGITIGVSTTGCFSKTASTHAFISGDAI